MSEKGEIALGVSSQPQIIAAYGNYPDSNLLRYIDEVGQRMAKVSHRSKLPFKFHLLDSDVVNAFAVPGGYVYFTRGIMAHFNNEAQFAGVMGHEIGHVTARHGAQQQTRQIVGQVALIGAMIASPQVAQYGEQLSQGMQLLFLKFGRDHESQSDKLGVSYSSKIGYDAHQMADFFLTLNRLSGGEEDGQRLPTFLSTHPDPVDRNQNVHKMATEFQTAIKRDYAINRDQYLRRIDGIIYGADPRQGYVENNQFYHPELKFQFPIPKGWKHVNSPSQFQMASPDQKAMMILALAGEKTPAQAAAAFLQKNQLRALEQREMSVNGLSAYLLVADQIQQQQQGQQQQAQTQAQGVRIATLFILYNNLVYRLHGLSEIKDYNNYENTFGSTMRGFNVLNDPSKINVKPERVVIKTINKDATLEEALRGFGMAETRLKELSVLNGMQLTDRVSKGMLIKTVGK